LEDKREHGERIRLRARSTREGVKIENTGSTRDWIFCMIVMISRTESTRGREEDIEEGSEEDAASPSEAEAEPEDLLPFIPNDPTHQDLSGEGFRNRTRDWKQENNPRLHNERRLLEERIYMKVISEIKSRHLSAFELLVMIEVGGVIFEVGVVCHAF
jgi:hypothetical protein